MSAAPWTEPRPEAVRGASDPTQLRARLATWFAAQDRPEQVESVAIERVFYVPGSEFTAVYALTLRHGTERVHQLLSGSIRYEGDDGELMAKATRRVASGKFVVPAGGAPVYHIPEWSLVLWTFPNDPKLRTLPAAQRPEVVREALGRLGGPALANGDANSTREPGDHWQVGAVDPAVVRYIPRRRCVFRFDLEWRPARATDGSSHAPPAVMLQRVYAKLYDDESAVVDAWRIQETLWRLAASDPRWLRLPRPLYLDPGQLMLYQTALPGAHLANTAAAVTPGQTAGIAQGLALLQQARLPLGSALSLEDELSKVREAAGLIARVQPQLAATLESLVARLAAILPGLPRLPLVPCHGTFKLNHLLHDGARVGLVDFDSMVLGDPLYDVANFTADLHYLEAHGALPGGRARRLGRTFYEAWCDRVPWGRRDAVLDWYVGCLLLRKQALKPVKHLHADAAAKIDRILAVAQERLGG